MNSREEMQWIEVLHDKLFYDNEVMEDKRGASCQNDIIKIKQKENGIMLLTIDKQGRIHLTQPKAKITLYRKKNRL